MKHKKWALAATFIFASTYLKANPIFITRHQRNPLLGDIPSSDRIAIIAMALAVEMMVVVLVLRKLDHVRWLRLIGAFLVLHLISYPITLLLASPLGLKAELFPMVFEIWLFPKLAKLTTRETWEAVLIGNTVSFTLGIVLPQIYVAWIMKPITYLTYS